MLIRKLLKGKKKAEKKARKAKKTFFILSLCCAFCLGAGLTGLFVYRNRERLAVMTVGRRKIRPRRLFKLLRRKK